MKSYIVKSETAEKLRNFAPALGLAPSDEREIVGPGIEAIHLPDRVAVEFDAMRKAAKVSADVLISRILKSVAA